MRLPAATTAEICFDVHAASNGEVSDGAIWPVGVQCKKKSVWPVSKLTTAELDEEVDKAKDFTPPLQAFYLVTALIRIRVGSYHPNASALFSSWSATPGPVVNGPDRGGAVPFRGSNINSQWSVRVMSISEVISPISRKGSKAGSIHRAEMPGARSAPGRGDQSEAPRLEPQRPADRFRDAAPAELHIHGPEE